MRLLPSVCLAALLTGGMAGSAPGPRVTGVPEAGSGEVWSTPVPGEASAAAPLLVPRWAPPLPPLAIDLLDGGTFRTAEQKGKVLLLDVWASWCEPCKIELPHLQALVEAEGPHGLVAIAINAQEPREVAARAAAAFEIKVPVGLYDEALDAALQVRSLPAVLLVDRQGLVRARWDGYRVGLEQEIAARTRALLDEPKDAAGERVGEVIFGARTMTPRSWRELGFPATGAAAVRRAEGGDRLILQGAGALWAIDPDGSMSAGPGTPGADGRLLAGDLDGDGKPEVIGWRRGQPEVLVADLEEGVPERWRAPGPVLDVAVLPGGRIVIATPDALAIADRKGIARPVPGAGGALALAVRGGELWAIDARTRHPRRYRVEGDGLAEQEAPASASWPRDAWQLASVGPAWIVAPSGTELVSGSFTGPGRQEVAIGSGRGEVTVLDAKTGERRFALRLDADIAQLVPVDLEGDGTDELAIVCGRGLLVMGGVAG